MLPAGNDELILIADTAGLLRTMFRSFVFFSSLLSGNRYVHDEIFIEAQIHRA